MLGKNSLPPKIRRAAIDLLAPRLAELVDLYTQCKQAHWNVRGPSFIALHELFDRAAAQAQDHADAIAERLVALGGRADGTAGVVARTSRLPEYPLVAATGRAHVDALSTAVTTVAAHCRESIARADAAGDPLTADLFTQVARDLDKLVWLIEAHNRAPR